jgi:hypothetical protein
MVDSRQCNNPAQEGTFMVRILRSTLIVALAVLFVVPVVALAADETVSGTIQSVDTRKGQITLKSDEGKTVQLQAPAALLAGLEAGDAVQVKVSGQKATMIHRQEGAQRPDMGGTMPRQQPGQQPGTMPRQQQDTMPRSQ